MNVVVFIFFVTTYPVTELHSELCDYDCVHATSVHPYLLAYSSASAIGSSSVCPNSRGTHLCLACVRLLAIASLDKIIQVLVFIWTWIFSLQYFQHMNDHIPKRVNCRFKRFAVLQTL